MELAKQLVELAELFADVLADILADVTVEVLVELTSGTELVQTELIQAKLV